MICVMRFICHAIAYLRATSQPEWSGILIDYDNGKFTRIMVWADMRGQQQSMDIVENALLIGRDKVYVVLVKVGPGCGYFVVMGVGSKFTRWTRGFWEGIYNCEEAFADMEYKARKVADKLGFRRVNL